MQTETLEVELPIEADIIALDKNERIVVLIEVKVNQAKEKAAKQRITDGARINKTVPLKALRKKGGNSLCYDCQSRKYNRF